VHEPPFVSVVIPSYNRRDSLLSVIAALSAQIYPSERYEIIVVLDGSDDGSQAALAEAEAIGQVRVLWQPNQGAGRARNRGAEAARGDLVVFLDDDVVPRDGLLAAHVAAHAQSPGGAVLGQMLLAVQGPRSVIVRWEEEWYARHFAELARADYAFECWDFFAGNVSLARQDFLDLGGFDASFTNYGCEDWELGLRLLKSGRPLRFCAEAVAEHRYALDFDGWQHHAYWDGRSEVRFARKFPEIKGALQLAAYYQGSAKRRVARRLMDAAPGAWPSLVGRLCQSYQWAERTARLRLAARLAKLVWAYRYWCGLRDELGGGRSVDRFVGFRIPILVYHRVTDRPHPRLAEYAVSARTLRRQLAWVRASGHEVISLAALYDAYRGAAPLPARPVVITFDDGYDDTGRVAAPILREFGYPATLFAVADRVGDWNTWDARFGPPAARLLDWDGLRELAATGWEIGGHSATHASLPDLPAHEVVREVGVSRAHLEQHLGAPVRWFAYPHGDHDRGVRQVTRDAGYLAAFTFDGGHAGACDDLMMLPRIPVGEADGVAGLAVKLATGDDWWTAVKRRVPRTVKQAVRGR
jgi:GT2 family glycosyltransferase/peptidoglycan/xylan/chitin deacetylase (PgdA/CDA1 family)